MISISRSYARQVRALFRRSILGLRSREPIPPLVLRAEETQLRVQFRYGALALEHVQPGVHAAVTSVALPLDALSDFEGRHGTPVILEAIAPDQTRVRWDDSGIPQTRTYEVADIGSSPELPELPTSFHTAPPELLVALKEAVATADHHATRYALDCIQLRGRQGQVVATDGRQLLIQGGFHFPWLRRSTR